MGAQVQQRAKVTIVSDSRTQHGFGAMENVIDLTFALLGGNEEELFELDFR